MLPDVNLEILGKQFMKNQQDETQKFAQVFKKVSC